MVNGTLRRAESAAALLRSRRWQPLWAHTLRGLMPAALFRVARLVICRLDEPPATATGCLTLRFAGRDDLDALCAVRDRRRAYRRYLDAGARPVLGWLGERPATICWLEPGRVHLSPSNGYRFEMEADEVWAFGCEVSEPLRRRGLYREHWARLMEILRHRGVHAAYLAVMQDDARSLAAHRRIGFEPVWQLSVVRLCGITRHRAVDLRDGQGRVVSGFGRWKGASRH